jgi:hypothetical protein
MRLVRLWPGLFASFSGRTYQHHLTSNVPSGCCFFRQILGTEPFPAQKIGHHQIVLSVLSFEVTVTFVSEGFVVVIQEDHGHHDVLGESSLEICPSGLGTAAFLSGQGVVDPNGHQELSPFWHATALGLAGGEALLVEDADFELDIDVVVVLDKLVLVPLLLFFVPEVVDVVMMDDVEVLELVRATEDVVSVEQSIKLHRSLQSCKQISVQFVVPEGQPQVHRS